MDLKKIQIKEFNYTYGIGKEEEQLREINNFLKTLFPYEIKAINDDCEYEIFL